MNITDVENLAELAKLDLSKEEKDKILKDMGGILDYVKIIESVELDEVEPNYDVYNAWREDVVKDQYPDVRELIKDQFPAEQDGFLKVKKIL